MKKSSEEQRTVDCYLDGVKIVVPLRLFIAVTMRMQYDERKYIRYKEGAKMYCMSEREFYKLAHDAGAVYKRNKMALVKIADIDRYLECCKESPY